MIGHMNPVGVGGSGGASSSDAQVVEQVVVESATSLVTFSGLSGDDDQYYELYGHMMFADAAAEYALRLLPNGLGADLESTLASASKDGGNAAWTHSTTDWWLGRAHQGLGAILWAYIWPAAGYLRHYIGGLGSWNAAWNRNLDGPTLNLSRGTWTDEATGMSSLGIECVTWGGASIAKIAAGSLFTLLKFPAPV